MGYRIRCTSGSVLQYLDKYGSLTLNAIKARIYSGLGPLKNSVGHWTEDDCKGMEVVEVELRETGQTVPLLEVLAPLKAKRTAEEQQRTSTERLQERKQELAELDRLKAKYPGGK